MSLLAALTLLAAQAGEFEPYRALGAAPLWQATINRDFMSFLTPGREMLVIETPPRQETELGFAHSTDAISISVEHAACRDARTHAAFADRVSVRIGEAHYEGCGGPVVREAPANVP